MHHFPKISISHRHTTLEIKTKAFLFIRNVCAVIFISQSRGINSIYDTHQELQYIRIKKQSVVELIESDDLV